MKSFESRFIDRALITQRLLQSVRAVGEFKGKEELYKSQIPQALETLRQAAIIQSTESSNRIEGVTAPLKRIQQLVLEKTKPRNRSEAEIAGYRDVLDTIHTSHAGVPFTPRVVLQFHRHLYRFTDTEGGKWKPVDNEITQIGPDGARTIRFKPVPAFATGEYMEKLHDEFNERWKAGSVEKLLLIPAYVLDFLCIHPFLDGNGRMARLLTLLLLYQAGYDVGRYISLEKIVEESKETYYEALYNSSQGWHKGKHDLQPWTEYLLGVILAAYKEFENRTGFLTTSRGAKTEMVQEVIASFHGDFSVKDLQVRCPHVGIDLIRRILANQRRARKLKCLGKGPEARWRKK